MGNLWLNVLVAQGYDFLLATWNTAGFFQPILCSKRPPAE
jgi:hypothetical protein